MWLNLLMDDCYLNNIEKVKKKNVVPNHIWENKNLQFLKMDKYITKTIVFKI
jgi:hypothetical protein